MFNTNLNNQFSYNINAVSGTLRKSHPKSKICVRTIEKDLYVFSDNTPLLNGGYGSKEIVVLQVMLTGENKCLVEYVNKSDFVESEQEANDGKQ